METGFTAGRTVPERAHTEAGIRRLSTMANRLKTAEISKFLPGVHNRLEVNPRPDPTRADPEETGLKSR